MNRHRAARRRTSIQCTVLLMFFGLAVLLVTAVALPPADAQAATQLLLLCPPEPAPEPPSEPSVARPRAQVTGEDINGGDLVPGDEILWTVTVKNIGGTTLTGIIVKDIVPEGTSYVDGSIAGSGAEGGGAPTLTWSVGALECGARVTLSFRSRVDDGVPEGTYITNQASADSAQTPPGVSKAVSMKVAGSAVESSELPSVVLSASSSPTTVPGGATGAAAAVGAEDSGSPETAPPSSTPTTLLEAIADAAPGPVTAASSDDGEGSRVGLGLGLGLGGLAVIGLGTGLVVRRRRQAA